MENIFCGSKEVELVLVEDENDFIDPLETDIFLGAEELQIDENKFQLNDDVYSGCNLLNSEQAGECESTTLPIITTADIVKIDDENENSIDSCLSFNDNDSDDIYMPTSNLKSKSKASKSGHDKQNKRYSDDPNSIEINIIEDQPCNRSDSNHHGSRKINEKRTQNTTKKMTRSVVIEKKPIRKNSLSSEMKQTELVECRVRPDPKRKRADARHYSQRNAIPKKTEHNEAYDKKLLKCKICDIQFEKSPYFTEHMRSEHENDKPFECYICSKTYRICSLLAEHIRYHFGEKPYICTIESCNRSFSQLQPFKAHVRKFHTGERPFKCDADGCKESFYDTKSLKEHIREHNPSTIPYQCDQCSKRFHHSGTFKAHMRIHTGETPYVCEFCGKKSSQKSTHNAHMLTHTNEYKFACNRCDKTFKQRTSLKVHLRTHLKTDNRPHICSDCGRAFAQLVSYRNHRLIHTGERPFNCTYVSCTRTFRHRNSLKRHLLTHSGERPYHCNVCLIRFCQVSSLNKHMKKHQKMVD